MRRTYQLRLLDSVHEAPVHELPSEYSGTLDDCRWYALEKGYQWRRSANVFGGYYAHPVSGNVLYITLIEPSRV